MSRRIRIAWLSRHALLPSQRDALLRLFPGAEIVHLGRWRAVTGDDGAEIVRMVQRGEIDEAAAVAPLSYLARLCEEGIRPLWAEMRPARPGEEPEVVLPRGVRLVFDRWRRVEALRLEMSEVCPRA